MTLRDALWHRQTTQVAVAKKVKCSNQLLSMHVRGKRKLTEKIATRVAKVLRCEVRQVNGKVDFTPVESK